MKHYSVPYIHESGIFTCDRYIARQRGIASCNHDRIARLAMLKINPDWLIGLEGRDIDREAKIARTMKYQRMGIWMQI